MDVRPIGRVVKQSRRFQKRMRPLRPGCSIGHVNVTAGTLGTLVKVRTGGRERIVSNNHVLADENRAARGDPILQPAAADGGRRKRDVVARLDRFVKLRRRGSNTVDAALAVLEAGLSYVGHPEPLSVDWPPKDPEKLLGRTVYKIGRTTGLTEGRISAFEIDGLLVEYDTGTYLFDGQLEIEPLDPWTPFSLGGDSGSIIVDKAGEVVGLLFAGNDADTTYANPFGAVLEAFGASLAV